MLNLKKLVVSSAVLVLVLSMCSAFAYAEGTKTGTAKGDSLNLRESPKTSAKILTQISKGTELTILSSLEGWYKISYKDMTGFVSSEFVAIKEVKTATITGDNVNVRSEASKTSKVLVKLNEGEKVSVLGITGDWYNIKTTGGTTGWVFGEFISTTEIKKVSRGDEEVVVKDTKTAEDQSTGQKIVEYAKKFVGVKYVYGGSSPKGFDCSGFTLYVYDNFGIGLERVAANQAKQGTLVKKADLKAGDLVFFDTDGGHNYICHVGIYIGDGNFIHASSGRSAHKVVISNLSSGFYSDAFMTARRFIK